MERLVVTMHVSAWFGRDERPPTSGVSPIRLRYRTVVRGRNSPNRTTGSCPMVMTRNPLRSDDGPPFQLNSE